MLNETRPEEQYVSLFFPKNILQKKYNEKGTLISCIIYLIAIFRALNMFSPLIELKGKKKNLIKYKGTEIVNYK